MGTAGRALISERLRKQNLQDLAAGRGEFQVWGMKICRSERCLLWQGTQELKVPFVVGKASRGSVLDPRAECVCGVSWWS